MIIFDLDGTLVNSLDDLTTAVNHVMKINSFPTITTKQCKEMIGYGLKDLITRSLPKESQNSEMIDRALSSMIEFYNLNCTVYTKPYDGIRDLLKLLQDRGEILTVFSNKADHLTKMIIKSIFPEIQFKYILGATDKLPKKPAPDGAIFIADQLEVDPREIYYIGDSETDMKTAKSANMKAVGVTWGFRDRETIIASGSDYIVESPMEILDIIER